MSICNDARRDKGGAFVSRNLCGDVLVSVVQVDASRRWERGAAKPHAPFSFWRSENIMRISGFSICKIVLLMGVLFAQLTGQTVQAAETKPIRVILVGDSTMNTKTGYGDALCALFEPDVKCINLARGGRSSKSFRAEGLWENVQALLKDRDLRF